MLGQLLNPVLVEYLGAALALLYLLLAMKESWWCWPAAIVSSFLYFLVFFEVKLYTEALLQIFYALMAIFGWTKWRPDACGNVLEKIKVWPLALHLKFGAFTIALTLPIAFLLYKYTDAALPWVDAPLTTFSILTTYLVAIKVLGNWIYWIVIDAISIVVYAYKGLHVSALLFLIYTVLAYIGWRRWRREYYGTNQR